LISKKPHGRSPLADAVSGASLPIVEGYRRLAPSGQAEGSVRWGFVLLFFFPGLPPGRREEANRFSRPAVKK